LQLYVHYSALPYIHTLCKRNQFVNAMASPDHPQIPQSIYIEILIDHVQDSIIFSCPPPWNDAGEVGAVTVTQAKPAESSMDTVASRQKSCDA
jgi:hypothetical protein